MKGNTFLTSAFDGCNILTLYRLVMNLVTYLTRCWLNPRTGLVVIAREKKPKDLENFYDIRDRV
jgi:hypothetical protein